MRSAGLHIALLIALLAQAPEAMAEAPPAVAASPWLKDLRRSMLRGADLSDRNLQHLADAGEGLAAARYAKRLEARNDPAYLDDAAHYYAIAVYMGRDFAVPRLIAVLRNPAGDYKPSRLNNIRTVLARAAQRGNAAAAAGFADLLILGTPFGKDIPLARELLLAAAEAGDTDAAIRLALSHISGEPGLPSDPDIARRALELAVASPDLGTQTMALSLAARLSSTALHIPEADFAPEVVSDVPETPALLETPVETVSAFPPRPRPRPLNLKGAGP